LLNFESIGQKQIDGTAAVDQPHLHALAGKCVRDCNCPRKMTNAV
jgi:hypothetical protein